MSADHRHQYADGVRAFHWGVPAGQCRWCERTRKTTTPDAPRLRRTGERAPLSLARSVTPDDIDNFVADTLAEKARRDSNDPADA